MVVWAFVSCFSAVVSHRVSTTNDRAYRRLWVDGRASTATTATTNDTREMPFAHQSVTSSQWVRTISRFSVCSLLVEIKIIRYCFSISCNRSAIDESNIASTKYSVLTKRNEFSEQNESVAFGFQEIYFTVFPVK